jgi:ubiquinone/menaquinone biosynthesis C-methylase UbiE
VDFYRRVTGELVQRGSIHTDDRILVVCGGSADREALLAVGMSNVVISNLDERIDDNEPFAPFGWDRQDAENLTYGDGAFAWVIVHAGLHHCASPHRALTEMLRVASRGVVVFEARDSAAMRLAVRLGLARDYEVDAVTANGGRFGGVRNSAVPNYVYRWTEREVHKVVNSLLPMGEHDIEFFHGLRLPTERLEMAGSTIKLRLLRLLAIAQPVIERVAPSQGNEFAFVIQPNRRLQPWVEHDGEGYRFRGV